MSSRQKIAWNTFSPREKLNYIWNYYKWVFVLLIVIISLAIGITEVIGNSRKKAILTVAVTGANSIAESPLLTTSFEEYLGEIEKQEFVKILPINSTNGKDSTADYAALLQLSAMTSSAELDILLLDTRESYHDYSSHDSFLNLEELFGTDFINTYSEIITSKGDALIVDSSPSLDELTPSPNSTYYLSILANTTKLETAKKFILFFLENQHPF